MRIKRNNRKSKFIRTLLCCYALHAISPHAIAGELNPSGRDIELQVPLLLGSLQVGIVTLYLSKDDDIELQGSGLVSLLEGRLNDQSLSRIKGVIDENDKTQLDKLQSDGFVASYDSGTLSVIFDVDKSLLQTQQVSVLNETQARTPTDEPSWFSSFLNIRAATVTSNSADLETQSFLSDVDGVSRFGPVAVLYEASAATDDTTSTIRRNRIAAVYESRAARRTITFGEYLTDTESLQEGVKLLGVSIGRDYKLTPNYIATPSGRSQFTLDNSATVDVIANGRLKSSIRLNAGRYQLSDIPLTGGENQIKLRIRSVTGEERELDFSVFQTRDLLDIGEIDYYLGAGVAGDSDITGEKYASDRPVISGFLRRGINTSTTLSVNLQATDGFTGIGSTLTLASPAGPVSLDYKLTNSRSGTGSIGSFSFGNYGGTDASAGSFSVSLELASRNQSSISSAWSESAITSTDESTESSRQTLAFNYTKSLGNVELGLGFNAVNSALANDKVVISNLDVGGTITGGLGWSLGLSSQSYFDENASESDQQSLTGRLQWRPTRNSRATITSRSRDASTSVGLSAQRNLNRKGGYNAFVSADHAQPKDEAETLAADFRGEYYANYAIAGAEHRTSFENRDRPEQTVSSVRLETAIAYASGVVAVGRPITNSFGIAKAHPTLSGRTIAFDPTKTSNLVETGVLGRVIVPDLGLHNSTTLRYEVEDLPLGYDLGNGLFQVDPWLGMGFALEVGSDATATAIGVLINSKTGEPFSLAVGIAEPLSNKSGDAIEFFTNRTGKFAISGLAPGSYRLVIGGDNLEAEIEVTVDQGNLVKLGEIKAQ